MTVKSISKTIRRLYILTAFFLAIAGCDSNSFFIQVAHIEGVPETGTVGTPLTLTATVRPAFASNQTIIWSVKNAGTTDATISGNILNAAAVGTVTIRAIITNGIAEGKDYTQDFKIVFKDYIGVAMVSIPGGTFTMGSPANEPNRYNDETQHQVTLSGFKMSKYQVTQEQYQAVMGNAEDRTIIDYGKGDNYPIYYVNWYDAIVFCNKLSIKEGLNPVYSINGSTNPSNWGNIPTNSNETWNAAAMDKNKSGYRLPTEAEWEYACRAGTITPFNTGDNITTDQSNYNGNFPYNGNVTGINRGQTTPVENFAPNAYGLYDMHGNLNEWCWDWYKADITEDNANPTGVANGTSRVERGGYWGDAGQYLRSAYRGKNAPNTRSYMIGFRLVRP